MITALKKLYGKALTFAEKFTVESTAYSVAVLIGRLAVAQVFYASYLTKVDGWPLGITSSAFYLFESEYNVPLLPPVLSAYMGTFAEMFGAFAVAFGLFSRLGAFMLLGVTVTIQLFVYPESWKDHVMWFALLLMIFLQGPGRFSLDHVFAKRCACGSS